MRRTFAVTSLCLLLGACTPAPPKIADPDKTTANDSCSERACLSGTLTSGACKPDGGRGITLSVSNTGSEPARYRLDYFAPEIAPVQGDPGQVTIESKQTQQYNFVSSVFNKPLKVTVAQLTLDGGFIAAPDKVLDVNLKPC